MQVMKTPTTTVTYSFRDKDHPIWGILKPMVLTGMVSFLLWLFASNFDSSEVKTILFTLFGSYGLEGLNARRRN